MKRLGAFAAMGILLLSGCRRAGDLSPAEVLQRSMTAGAQLQSVDYEGTASLSQATPPMTLQATAKLQGTLSHGGQQTAFSVDIEGTTKRIGQSAKAFHFSSDVVSESQNLFVRARTVSPALLPSGAGQEVINVWWSIPGEKPSSVQSLTPDPQFLRAQAAVVTVTGDKGLVSINGRDAYRYAVTIDPERLVALMKSTAEQQGKPFDEPTTRSQFARYDTIGELWIDAGTFFPLRLQWTITSKENPPAERIEFAADLRHHNAAAPIVLPENPQILDRSLLQNILPALPTVPFFS